MSANTGMEIFSRPPLSVHTKSVDPNATYEDVILWLHSEDTTAAAAVRAVQQNNCVLFIQIGGAKEVLCCAPHSSAPDGYLISTKSTKKARGKVGTALMMLYQ